MGTWRRAWAVVLVAGAAACGRKFAPLSIPVAALTATADRTALAPKGAATITVSGGVPPYTAVFAVGSPASGTDATLHVQGASVRYVAGSLGNVLDVVAVGDSQSGAPQVLTFTVGPPLAISPPRLSVAPTAQALFTASGGQPPYVFQLQPGCGADGDTPSTLDPSSGAYVAGQCPAGSTIDEVLATDANGAVTAPALVSVGELLHAGSVPPQLSPGAAFSFVASGGLPPYAFAFARHGNASGGTLDPSGAYVAGIDANVVDRLVVTDALGASSAFVVDVGPTAIPLSVPESMALTTADFNGDGFADLVALPIYSVGGGGGAWLGSTLGLTVDATWRFATDPESFVTGPLANSGRDDLVLVTQDTPAQLRFYFGSDDGTLTLSESLVTNDSILSAVVVPSWQALGLAGADNQVDLYVLSPDGGYQATPSGILPLAPLASLDLGGLVLEYVYDTVGLGALSARDTTLALIADGTGDDGGGFEALMRWELPSPGAGGLGFADGGPLLEPASITSLPNSGPGMTNLSWVVAVLDLDGDGLDDVAAVGSTSTQAQTLVVLLGLADGGSATLPAFGLSTPAPVVSVHGAVVGLAAGESLDVASNSDVGVQVGWRDGGLALVQPLPGTLFAVAAGDFDGDGASDLACSFNDGRLEVLEGSPTGALGEGHRLHLNLEGSSPIAVVAGDLDGDGFADLLSTDYHGVSWFGGTDGGHLGHDGRVLGQAHLSPGCVLGPSGAWVTTQEGTGPVVMYGISVDAGALAATEVPLPQLDAGPATSYLSSLRAGGVLDGGDLALSFEDAATNWWVVPLQFQGDGGFLGLPTAGPFDIEPTTFAAGPSVADGLLGRSQGTYVIYPPASSGWATVPSFTIDQASLLPSCVGSSRVDLQACKLEYSIVSPK